MKFPQLPIGQRFLFQGEPYLKVGPLTARRERDGEDRLIPRSALVALPSPKRPDPVPVTAGLSLRVARALDAYDEALRSVLLASGSGDACLQGRLDLALAQARDAFQACMAGPEVPPG